MKTHSPATYLPDIAAVDFDIPDEAGRFAVSLITAANALGITATATRLQSAAAVAIYRAAREWVAAVKKRLLAMPPAQALGLTDLYEVMHRIAYRNDDTPAEVTRARLTAFGALVRGDKSIDEYLMFRTVRKALRQRERGFAGEPMRWMFDTLERWHHEAAVGYDHTALTDYDIANRTAILLESDLFAFEGSRQADFKRRLAATRPAI